MKNYTLHVMTKWISVIISVWYETRQKLEKEEIYT